MMNIKFRITERPDFIGFGYDIRLLDIENHQYVSGMEITQTRESEQIPVLFTMEKEDLIGLMNELWNLGIRPSNGSGDANAFEAVKYHLEDMRRIVFNK